MYSSYGGSGTGGPPPSMMTQPMQHQPPPPHHATPSSAEHQQQPTAAPRRQKHALKIVDPNTGKNVQIGNDQSDQSATSFTGHTSAMVGSELHRVS